MSGRISFNKPQGQPVTVNQTSNYSNHSGIAGQSPPPSYIRSTQGVRQSGHTNVRTSGVAAAPYVATTVSGADPRVSGHSHHHYQHQQYHADPYPRQTVGEHHSSYRESDKPLQEKHVHHGYHHNKHVSSDHDDEKKKGCSPVVLGIIGFIALALLILALLYGLGVIGGNNPDPNNVKPTAVAAANRPTTTTTTTTTSTSGRTDSNAAVTGTTGVSSTSSNSNGYYDSNGQWHYYNSLSTNTYPGTPATTTPLYAPATN